MRRITKDFPLFVIYIHKNIKTNRDMKQVLTEKGWNYVATLILILAGIAWGTLSNYGDLGKILGCVTYVSAPVLWIKKTGWAKQLLNVMDEME